MNEFCSSKSTPLVMDTTFDLCNLWLTDTAYQNQRILNKDNKHPWFYGPVLLHMKKTPETFARFALVVKSGLKSPNFLGTDLEKAMFKGFSRVKESPMCQALSRSRFKEANKNRSKKPQANYERHIRV